MLIRTRNASSMNIVDFKGCGCGKIEKICYNKSRKKLKRK